MYFFQNFKLKLIIIVLLPSHMHMKLIQNMYMPGIIRFIFRFYVGDNKQIKISHKTFHLFFCCFLIIELWKQDIFSVYFKMEKNECVIIIKYFLNPSLQMSEIYFIIGTLDEFAIFFSNAKLVTEF